MKPMLIGLWAALIVILISMHFFLAPLSITDVSTPSGIMQILISVGLLTAALYVILSGKYEPDVQKWAFGIIGTIVGYWLKP